MTDSENPIRSRFGTASPDIARGLREFSKSAAMLANDGPRLIDEHSLQWIGVCRGEVSAKANDLPSLMEDLERQGVPLGDTIVRFIEKYQRTLILQYVARKVRRFFRPTLHGGLCPDHRRCSLDG